MNYVYSARQLTGETAQIDRTRPHPEPKSFSPIASGEGGSATPEERPAALGSVHQLVPTTRQDTSLDSPSRCLRARARRGRRRRSRAPTAPRRGLARPSPRAAGDHRRQIEARPPPASSKACSALLAFGDRFDEHGGPPAWRDPLRRPRRGRPRRASNGGRACLRASLVIFAGPPAMVTRGTGWARKYFKRPPTKSPMSISA